MVLGIPILKHFRVVSSFADLLIVKIRNINVQLILWFSNKNNNIKEIVNQSVK